MAKLLAVSPALRMTSHPMTMRNSSINYKYKSHFNLLWGSVAKLPPYFITEVWNQFKLLLNEGSKSIYGLTHIG